MEKLQEDFALALTDSEEGRRMMDDIHAEMREQRKQLGLRGEAALKKFKFIPWSEFETRFGITQRDEDQAIFPTDIGELEFWSFSHEGLEYIPLEDIALMMEQLGEMVLFGFMQLGNDTCTVRPHQLYPDVFGDGSAQYTDAYDQREVDEYYEQMQEFKKQTK